MTTRRSPNRARRQPLRLWPGVVAPSCPAGCAGRRRRDPRSCAFAMMAAVVGAAADRRVVAVLQPRALARARGRARPDGRRRGARRAACVHPSIAGAGMGWLLYFCVIPVLSLALVAGAAARPAARRRSRGARRWPPPSCSPAGRSRSAHRRHQRRRPSDLHWRWTPTPEERLLARGRRRCRRCAAGGERRSCAPPAAAARSGGPASARRGHCERPRRRARREPAASPPAAAVDRSPAPRRGARRLARLPRDPLATASFAACGSRPTGRRRRRSSCGAGAIGPGWSSFAVARRPRSTRRSSAATTRSSPATSSPPASRSGDTATRRFWESNGGAGPRGDADPQQRPRLRVRRDRNPERARRRDGAVVWSRNAAADTRPQGPGLGLHRARRWWSATSSSSPPPARSSPTTPPRASRAGSAPRAAAATARRTSRRSTASPQVLLLRGAGVDQRRAGRRRAALGAHVGGRRHRAAGPDRRTATS